MKKLSARTNRLPVLFPLLLIALAILSFATVFPAKADGGGWPTATPTVTRTPRPTRTPTATPEGALLELQATATYTVVPSFVENQGLTDANSLIASNPQATPAAASKGFSILQCWPFAIAIPIIAIVAYILLRGRLPQIVP